MIIYSYKNSDNKDYKLIDLKIEHFADEIEAMIKVYPKEVAIVKYSELKDEK